MLFGVLTTGNGGDADNDLQILKHVHGKSNNSNSSNFANVWRRETHFRYVSFYIVCGVIILAIKAV
jgi:hypothetical protein